MADQDAGDGDAVRTEPVPRARELPADAVRYEVVYDCRDRMLGTRLMDRLERSVHDALDVRRGDEGPTWSLHVAFASAGTADDFFRSDAYRQFCIETRRTCRSSVLVVPLGPGEA